jgi:glycosyltransferase involved in cell wall biosynthesis
MASICFVGLDNYPLLNREYKNRYIGGESVQQTLLASEFIELGYKVSMIVKDFGQAAVETRKNIRIHKICARGQGLPILRFFHPKLTSVMKALKFADADTYYQSCAGQMTGLVAWFCKRNGKKFVFRVAHDTDCIPNQQIISLYRDKKIYEYGLRHADLIAAQTRRQADLLKEHYGLESRILNMIAEVPPTVASPSKEVDVLWVNNLRPFKRPELLLEIASRLPMFRFRMIGGPCTGMEEYYVEIKASAVGVQNLEFLGPIPYEQVHEHFARARLLVNTSEAEGFPNTFLQAWMHGVPVLSFFDPDGVIQEQGVGRSPSDKEEMVRDLFELLTNRSEREGLSAHTAAFARSKFSSSAVAAEYDHLFTMFQEQPA